MTGQVAVFLPSLTSGGAEQFALDLARSLLVRGLEIDLVAASATGPLAHRLPEGVRLINLDRAGVMRAVPPLARYLAAERPAALLSIMDHANVAAVLARALARTKTRLVISVHTDMGRLAFGEGTIKSALVPLAMRLTYRWADHVVCVSEAVRERVMRLTRVPADRLTVVGNPISIAALRKSAAAPASHPWFAAGAPPVVLFVGRLNRQKNVAFLLQAFARAVQVRDLRLCLIGEGPEQAALAALAEELGIESRVAFLGYLAEPAPFIRQAAVLALPSKVEGSGRVLIEALALATPVIALSGSGGPEEILAHSHDGKLIEPEDVAAFAAAILAAAGAPASPAGNEELFERFRPAIVAEHYAQLLGVAG